MSAMVENDYSFYVVQKVLDLVICRNFTRKYE